MDIVCSLVGPFIRQGNQSHLPSSIKQKYAVIRDMMQLPNSVTEGPNIADVGNFPSKSGKRSRCYVCVEQLPANRNQKCVSEIKLLCHACSKHTCPKHVVQKCEHCAQLFCYILSYYDMYKY